MFDCFHLDRCARSVAKAFPALLALAAIALSSACTQRDAQVPATAPETTPATQAAKATEPRADADVASPVPADVVVSTNEPFWQARVDGAVVTLTGADITERKLAIQSSDADAKSRSIRAKDAQGTVELRVMDEPCEDDMSGAPFPLTATLAIDGKSAVRGCARPASMPPPRPPEEAGAEAIAEGGATTVAKIPAPFLGHWAPDEAACRNPDSSIEGIAIGAQELRFHESIGVPATIESVDDRTLRLTSDYSGEGEQWTSAQTLRLSGADRLTITGPGDTRIERIRCAGS
jgi:uncharacterized membrane protein